MTFITPVPVPITNKSPSSVAELVTILRILIELASKLNGPGAVP
jgi:hypothetical protein